MHDAPFTHLVDNSIRAFAVDRLTQSCPMSGSFSKLTTPV
jgi:hypothetical protein